MPNRFKPKQLLAFATLLIAFAIPAAAEPAIWHLSDDDSDIYIFGTVHILPPELEWRTAEITAAFENAETIWFEAPAVDPAAQLAAVGLIYQYGLNPPGNPLSAQISDEAHALLDQIVSRFGIGAADLEAMRPWMAAMTLSLAYIQSQGYDPESGVENVLWQEANAAGKNISYFETMEEQIRFLADLPPDVEAEYLEQTLRDFDGAGNQLDELVGAWNAGDLATIDRVMNEETRNAAPVLHEVVLAGRNRNWIETIKGLLSGSGSHFIAVGAGHVVGAEGVVELLRAGGFHVTGP